MDVFDEYLAKVDSPSHRERLEEVFAWITRTFPQLQKVVKWNQPMFTDHGTFIIGFSIAKKHMAVAPESAAIAHLEEQIVKAGYDYTKQLVRIPWDVPVDYPLLEKMIEFNIRDKADCKTFWRK